MHPNRRFGVALGGFELDALRTRHGNMPPGDRKWAKTQFTRRLRHVRVEVEDPEYGGDEPEPDDRWRIRQTRR